MKNRFPDKVTLSIGDGANDVNMITTAHVGVGISGLEGMQAARSADYVIGQFRFLKQLLFKHGREAYRRNAFLVCYNFYKNIVMVLPNFWFGLFSIYSATFLYEKFIYLLYNIVFTSVPIVWFALFDYQFPRELFLIDPSKYKIGLNGECFGSRVFWYWFSYGALQAFMIIIFSFYVIEWESSSIYKSGSVVLGAVVMIVNIQVFYQSHVFDGIFVFVLIASIGLYFAFWAVMSMDFYKSDFLMGTYAPAMDEPVTYLGLLMIVVLVYILEKFTVLIMGQLYALKYNKEALRRHLNAHKQVNPHSTNTTGVPQQYGVLNINNSGGSSGDESAKDQDPK